MIPVCLSCVVLGLAVPMAGPKERATVKAEIEKLQGTWNVVSLEVEGGKMGEAAFKGSRIVVKGSGFTTVSMGATYKGTLHVDASAMPKKLDLHFTEGPLTLPSPRSSKR